MAFDDSDQQAADAALTRGIEHPASATQLRQVLVLATTQIWALAGYSILAARKIVPLEPATFFCVLGLAALAPMVSFGLRAIEDGQLPASRGGKPRHDHISGVGAVALALLVLGIVALATWATSDMSVNERIHEQWGAYILFGLAGLFALAAIVPGFDIHDTMRTIGTPVARAIKPFGDALSQIDSLLVFSVAPAVGATLDSRVGRYLYLAAYMTPLGVMGYWLPAPWGLFPLAMALVAAIAISRRWAWIEEDRETAMLNARFRGPHLKVGFDQDLRDEALLGFMSMFFLLPLALRQAHEWGQAQGATVFSITGVDPDHLLNWIQYFGSELAKAVPFVDWAEIYDVEGRGPIEMHSRLSQHIVFATRVLVDLVFLSALVQVLTTFARNAKQMKMFEEGVLNRLDPFIERREFRRLVRRSSGRWSSAPGFDEFSPGGPYSLERLIELKEGDHDKAVKAAADLLYKRFYLQANASAQLHARLLELSDLPRGKAPDVAGIAEVLAAIEKLGPVRQVEDLDQARRKLKRYGSANDVRRDIVRLITHSPDDPADDDYIFRTTALAAALSGEADWDRIAAVRRLAFDALRGSYLRGERLAILALRRAAETDQAPSFRKEIVALLKDNPRDLPPDEDQSVPTV